MLIELVLYSDYMFGYEYIVSISKKQPNIEDYRAYISMN